MRESMAVILAWIIWPTPAYCAQEPNPPSPRVGAEKASAVPDLTPKQAELRDRISKISLESWIEAKLQNEQMVTGRLKDTSAAGFTLLVPTPGELQDQTIHFTELMSFKRVGKIHPKTPTEQALLIPPGSLVTVRLKNQERIEGWLEEVSNDGILTQVGEGNRSEWRKISFTDVQAVSGARERKVAKAAETLMCVVLNIGFGFLHRSGGSDYVHSHHERGRAGKGSGNAHGGGRGH